MGNVVDKGTSFLFHVNRYVAGSETDMYKHGYAELLYVSDGSLTEHVCGDKVHIKKIINAVISNAMADKQAVDYIKELVKVLKNSGYIHFGYKDDYDNELKDMLTAMISECGVADMASAYICQGLMLRILWRLGTVYEYAQSRYIRKKINWLLHQEITDFIEDNMKDVTIDMLVERFGYQEDYFNRFLKAQTGMTFTEYLQDCRLNKSAILLKEDSMDVDEIIKEVGYRNKGYFYRIFTEKYNMTPAKFRKYIKEKEFTI